MRIRFLKRTEIKVLDMYPTPIPHGNIRIHQTNIVSDMDVKILRIILIFGLSEMRIQKIPK